MRRPYASSNLFPGVLHGRQVMLCVYIIVPYLISRKGYEEILILKAVTTIDTVTGLSEIIQYYDKRAISIANLVETTCISRYPIPMEMTYDQGSSFIHHELSKSLIETEYGITAKPSTWRNTASNAILEQIHQVLGNLVRTFNITQTYVDKEDPLLGILAAAAFEICSTKNNLKGYSLGKLIIGRDIIPPIKHNVD